MNKKIGRILTTTALLLTAIGIGTGFSAEEAAAKKTSKKQTVKLNKKKATIRAGKKVTLKVKNASGKVKWKSSNTKAAVVRTVKGKKKAQAVIQAKKVTKKTNAVITARIGKKSWKCRVTVKPVSSDKKTDTEHDSDTTVEPGNGAQGAVSSSAVSGASVGCYVTSYTVTGDAISVTAMIYNKSEKDFCFGLGFELEKLVNSQWVKVESKDVIAIPSVAMLLKPGAQGGHTYVLGNPKEPFTSGKYRITLELLPLEGITCQKTAEFDVTVPK